MKNRALYCIWSSKHISINMWVEGRIRGFYHKFSILKTNTPKSVPTNQRFSFFPLKCHQEHIERQNKSSEFAKAFQWKFSSTTPLVMLYSNVDVALMASPDPSRMYAVWSPD